MKILKRLCAALLAGAVLLTMSACHGKDEIALTVNDVKITSALYLNALLESDTEAKQRIDSETSDSSDTSAASEATDYYSKTLDGQKYVDYVKAQALKRCKEYAFYQTLVDNGTIKLTDEEKSEAEQYANIYWNYYQYNKTYESNGVAFETYKKAFLYSYYSNAYFMSLYGEGGEQAVSKEDIKKTLTEKYALVYTLSKTFDDETTDAEKTETKNKFNGYVTRLNKGEKFETIYKEYNNGTGKDVDTSVEDGPKDIYATLIGDEDTSSANADFETVFDMKKGEVKLIEAEDNAGYTIYVKLDITEDPYYLTSQTESILYILKQEDFDKLVDEKIADYQVDENTFATKRFKVKKLVYPTNS